MLDDRCARILRLVTRGSLAFAWFDGRTTAGFFWISRHIASPFFPREQFLRSRDGLFDVIVGMGASRDTRACSAVRLLRSRSQGRWDRSLTTVLHPLTVPASEVVRLHARRWESEPGLPRLLDDYLRLPLVGRAT